MAGGEVSHAFRVYWLIWFVAWFLIGFLPVEIYCLVKRNGGTLSESIWWLEGWRKGMTDGEFDNPWDWSAGHALFGGALTLVLLWLIFHFLLHRMH